MKSHQSKILHNSCQVTFFNITPSPRDDRDLNIDMILDEYVKIPRVLDWSSHLLEVRNQGVQGTSLAQAGSCILEWINRKIYKTEMRMSPQFIYNNREDNNSTVMCGRDLMKLLKSYGCCTENSCPYNVNNTTNSSSMLSEATEHAIGGYARVQTIETLKMAIFAFGPCVITFPVFNHTSYMWKQHNSEEKLGGHAMTIIGYNSSGFILRNSWGKYWEHDGHCIYPYADWGYHDEVWCIADLNRYKQWKEKPRNTIARAVRWMNKSNSPSRKFSDSSRYSGDRVPLQGLPKSDGLIKDAHEDDFTSDDPNGNGDVNYNDTFKDNDEVSTESNVLSVRSNSSRSGFGSFFGRSLPEPKMDKIEEENTTMENEENEENYENEENDENTSAENDESLPFHNIEN